MNEWEFTADVASWINEILLKIGDGLPFSRAKCEQREKKSLKRRDITLYDKNDCIVLTGEVKLPYQEDGSSPYNAKVVNDARKKATSAETKYFFTWNVNEFVLWETVPLKISWRDQNYKSWHVANVHLEKQLENPVILEAVKDWIIVFLNEFGKILLGITPIGQKQPDEKFIEVLESFLQTPIECTTRELADLYKKLSFRDRLDRWMREDQGWSIRDDPEGILDNLERTARFTCYALINKLVFYEALLKRYGVKMDRLSVPNHITTGESLRLHLESYFERAKKVTGDYETVFGESHLTIGNLIPFFSDSGVTCWRQLINQIHNFDFSKLDYEIIGNMCERLLSPEERHKYGQFYTRVEVVDLINSFCIRTGNELVMDPACGGGTFLVRAYARKRELSPDRKHGQLLRDIFGVDISNFATHMTTINLATRDLIDDENYPQIARSDFFDVEARKPFLMLPSRMKIKGLGKENHRIVEVPALDAVIGNPPYVRQEDIPKWDKKGKSIKNGTKEFYQLLIKRETNATLTARSDIHCYFWPHASSFLKNDGWICFVTSSQWLDVEYGFRLQDWILRNFKIIAILESIDEPWFVGARVSTTVTILRRESDLTKRMNNIVRFVQLRCPIAEILTHDGTTASAIVAADSFRDELLTSSKNTVNERYRLRLVNQGELWTEGVKLGAIVHGSKNKDKVDGKGQVLPNSEYYGNKWGIHLRAPDFWFTLVDKYGDKLEALSNIASIKRGITSGKDCFFFPKDHSAQCLNENIDPTEFEITFGIKRKLVESGKVKLVLCGEGRGEIRPIEAEFLEPEVHSLMEVDRIIVTPENCSRHILLVSKRKNALRGKYVLDYIKWGEKLGYHTGSTVAARVSENREWYDLTGHKRGQLFWPKAQQYKHLVPINKHKLISNCNLYDVFTDDEVDLLGGVLNSTWTILSKIQFGRPVGVEGNLKTEVIDVKMMLVPDPAKGTIEARRKVVNAFNKLKKRKSFFLLSEQRLREMAYKAKGISDQLHTLSDLSELDLPDRHELDDAVLQLMGVSNKTERTSLIKQLYAYLQELFEWIRQKEEKAIKNKKIAKRTRPASPNEIAMQIYNEIQEVQPHLLRRYDPDFLDSSKPFDVFDLPVKGMPTEYRDMFNEHGVAFKKGKKLLTLIKTVIPEQDKLLTLIAATNIRGLVRVPHEADDCIALLTKYQKFLSEQKSRVQELVASRTADEDLQEKIIEPLLLYLIHGE